MSADDLVIVDLADENALLLERLAIAQSYRDVALAAVQQLNERNREIEAARRRISALVDELRAIREAAAA